METKVLVKCLKEETTKRSGADQEFRENITLVEYQTLEVVDPFNYLVKMPENQTTNGHHPTHTYKRQVSDEDYPEGLWVGK